MRQYLDLLRLVYEQGEVKASRRVLESTGTKPKTRSLFFGYQNRYDLTQGFPLVTTKTVPFRQVVVEVLWFLSGSTNSVADYLQRHNVKIWDPWADETGRGARSDLRQAVARLGGGRRAASRSGCGVTPRDRASQSRSGMGGRGD